MLFILNYTLPIAYEAFKQGVSPQGLRMGLLAAHTLSCATYPAVHTTACVSQACKCLLPGTRVHVQGYMAISSLTSLKPVYLYQVPVLKNVLRPFYFKVMGLLMQPVW